jgi:hypothetical protein
MQATPGLASVMAGLAIIASAAGAWAQQTEQLSLPNVTVTAPATPAPAPYLRDPGKAYQRNPYNGRYRVEEDKFREVPCTTTRIAPATGGRCLQGYRRFRAKPCKKIVDGQAASPSSWKMPRIAP